VSYGSGAGVVQRVVLFVLVSALAGVLAAGLVLPAVGSVGLGAKAAAQGFENLPDELSTPPLAQGSRILASDGTLLATFYYENRISVPLAKVAPVMRQAIVAIEDSRFYEHGGIDLRGTLRAFVNNQGGGSQQGGSSLTQQYVKNVLVEAAGDLSDPKARAAAAAAARESSYSRKIRELRYAIALEDKLTKDQILERYLNIAYFGSGAYGVEAAARHYFNTSAARLNLQQAAMIAGIVQKPVGYDPTRSPKAAIARRNVVIGRMAQLGYISPAQESAAQKTPLGLRIPRTAGNNGCETSYAPFFCDYVLATIRDDPAFGKTQVDRIRLLLRGGLTVTTTLDPKMQRAAQVALRKHVEPTNPVASALVTVEPGTGRVKAMAVSRGYGDGRGKIKFNPAVNLQMGGSRGFQAGSTFKVFVMAAALEQGFGFGYKINSPYRVTVKPIKTCSGLAYNYGKPGGKYEVTNENTSEGGNIDMRTAIARSVNTYWVQMEAKTGLCRPVTIAEQLGVKRADGGHLSAVQSFTLGTNEIAPLDMANAYATFAARGVHCNEVPVTRVVDATGKSLPVPKANCEQVLDPKIADAMNTMLKGVIEGNIRGRTGGKLSLDRPDAGKTGTTQGRVAVWFIGYTPDLATAVWAGNPSPPAGGYSLANRTIGGKFFHDTCGGCLPGPIWHDMMAVALKGIPPTDFVDATIGNGSQVNGQDGVVPSVVGESRDQAISDIVAAGYKYHVGAKVQSSSVPAGAVAAQTPGGGSQLSTGSTVTIFLSSGGGGGPNPTPTCTKKGPPCRR
jgi:membrane peptidoglycan carboxypeptidase